LNKEWIDLSDKRYKTYTAIDSITNGENFVYMYNMIKKQPFLILYKIISFNYNLKYNWENEKKVINK
jgi:hypothetical protein